MYNHQRAFSTLVALLTLCACDASVQLCGEYACVFYQSDCEHSNNCASAKSCESAGSIRDRTPRILNELRQSRRNCGANTVNPLSGFQSLAWDDKLEQASTTHARDMAAQNVESFIGSNGLATADRLEQAGTAASVVSESIGSGPQTAAEIINAWLDVQSDCEQLLDPAYTRVALACALNQASNPQPFWSLLLAGPESAEP